MLWDSIVGGSRVTAFVGAGGKTSLITLLARETDKTVLITTTTKMYAPERNYGRIRFAGTDAGGGKIAFPTEKTYRAAKNGADAVLIEADGARHFPIKIPNAAEPVIPADAERITVVFGLNAIGGNARNVCHRWAGADRVADAELFVELLCDGYLFPLAERGGIDVKIALVYLASGSGRRFGGNKLLVPFDGEPLYAHGLKALRGAEELLPEHEVKIIAVSPYPEIQQAAGAIDNPEHGEGIAASVRRGTAAGGGTDYFLFFVADQPYTKPETIANLVRKMIGSGRGIGCVSAEGQNGNPAIFSKTYRPDLLALKGDTGAKTIIGANPADLFKMETDPRELIDIDGREKL